MKKISKKHILLYGVIIPSFWSLFIVLVYNKPGNPDWNPNISENIKILVSVINFMFSPIIGVVMPFALMQYKNITDEVKKSNINLFILFGLFSVITLFFHMFNLIAHWN